MPEVAKRSKLPWIVGGVILLIAFCGCVGGVAGVLYWRAGEGESEAERGDEDVGEWLAIRRAALSHKVHNDPFSAPAGHEVHLGQSEVVGPTARDTELLDNVLPGALTGPELLDALPDRPYAVNLYQDPGATTISRLTLDLDRDGKLDEQWRVEGTRVRRVISTNDDENYDQTWLWQGGLWMKR